MSEDERAIRNLIDTWMEGSKAGDLPRVLSLMTDDVIFLIPGRDPFGKDGFAAAAEGMKHVRFEGRSEIKELQVSGDWAWLRSHIEMTVISPSSDLPNRLSGYTLTILRKEGDGCWRVARDANFVRPEKPTGE